MRNVFTSKKASDTFTAQLLAAVFAGLGITSPDVAESIAKGKRSVVNTDLGEIGRPFRYRLFLCPGTSPYLFGRLGTLPIPGFRTGQGVVIVRRL